jgi:hypothetical protein
MTMEDHHLLVATPCIAIEIDRGFEGTYCPHFGVEGIGNEFFQNVGKCLPDYLASQPIG